MVGWQSAICLGLHVETCSSTSHPPAASRAAAFWERILRAGLSDGVDAGVPTLFWIHHGSHRGSVGNIYGGFGDRKLVAGAEVRPVG